MHEVNRITEDGTHTRAEVSFRFTRDTVTDTVQYSYTYCSALPGTGYPPHVTTSVMFYYQYTSTCVPRVARCIFMRCAVSLNPNPPPPMFHAVYRRTPVSDHKL